MSLLRRRHFHCIMVVTLIHALLAPETCAQVPDPDVAGNAQVAEFMKKFPPRGVMSDGSVPTPADEAVKQFRMQADTQIELMASEPSVSQPLFLSWDSRGRMWVVQYRQYQFPAGLKVIEYDQHLRAVFDRVPEPPPQGTSGKDVISVFEDTDGDGLFDTHSDVISGLNIATSVQVGHGGIWVLNPPYLLFYSDADGNDIPDAEPEVRLSGFGLQDTHSVANSLLWGPDGWLYGANGSTTTGTVSSSVTLGVSFEGQCIWRYHPDTHEFEIFAEGGGNTFSLEIDSKGRLFCGYNGGNTRGFYMPQGSYSSKNWGKHGPLTNPYAFGYFEPMRMIGDQRRFPQAFAIYEGGLFPEFDGNIIAPNSMQNLIWNSKRLPDGSTYRTEDVANLCESPDRWFRPVYGGVGPDGAIYVADWYDTRLSHVSPFDDWHKESGRVYRISPAASQPVYREGDLHTRPAEELLPLLSHPNKWMRQRAALEIGWRNEQPLLPSLIQLVEQAHSLEALWAVNLLGELTSARAAKWLQSDDEHIRCWVVRLLGDRHEALPEFVDLARNETAIQVRSQLAATAKRIPADIDVQIIGALFTHSQDVDDLQMPLMIWWGLEAHAQAWPEVKSLFSKAACWDLPIVHKHIAGRLAQRYASTGSRTDLERCQELVEMSGDSASTEALLLGTLRAYQGRTLPPLPPELAKKMAEYQASLGDSGLITALQSNPSEAIAPATKILLDSSQNLGLRIELAQALGATGHNATLNPLLQMAGSSDEPALQRVAIIALRNFSDEHIASELINRFGSTISAEHELRDSACRTLAARPSWAMKLLTEVLQWRLRKRDVPIDVVQQLRAYEIPEIQAGVEQAFGKVVAISSEEKLNRMQHLKALMLDANQTETALPHEPQPVSSEAPDGTAVVESGQLVGKEIFAKKCGTCHKLFGEGNNIGPPLDAYDRGNMDFWLIAMFEPSAEIREGYQSYAVLTDDGRVITGMIAAQNANAVTLRSADNLLTTFSREQIEELRALPTSLMPEDLLNDMSDEQLSALLRYVSQGAR